jgi:gamma-butyrobetaine dioxygenase
MLQGGPFGAAEAVDFAAQSHAMAAVALRRWDDQAKSPTRATPGWVHWRAVLERACRHCAAIA